jgi:hypothetical protein
MERRPSAQRQAAIASDADHPNDNVAIVGV